MNIILLAPPEGTSMNLPLDAYKASALPEGHKTTLRDIEIAIAEGNHFYFHILKEKYNHLPKSTMQSDGEGVIINEVNGKLMESHGCINCIFQHFNIPWTQLAPSWLLSEGRLESTYLEKLYIIIVEPYIFDNFHDLCELKGISFFNRYYGEKIIQLINNCIWNLISMEIKN